MIKYKQIALMCMFSVLFCSCNIIKQIDFVLKGDRMTKKTETTYNYSKKSPFVFDHNAIFIPCTINGITHLMYYDIEMRGISILKGIMTEKILDNAEFPQCTKTIKLKTKTSSYGRKLPVSP